MSTQSNLLRLLSFAVASATLGIPVANASPGELCLPDADPGPSWWTSGIEPERQVAQWEHALGRKLSHGASLGRMQALWSPATQLANFEFQVSGDPSLDPLEDTVIVAISDRSGTEPELFIQFLPLQDCAVATDCDDSGIALDPSAIYYSEASSVGTSYTWSPLANANPSVDLEILHPWVTVEDDGASVTWTLRFALALPVFGDEIADDRRVYGNAVQYDPGFTSGTYVEFPLACTPTSGTTNDCLMMETPGFDMIDGLPIGIIADAWPRLASGDGC